LPPRAEDAINVMHVQPLRAKVMIDDKLIQSLNDEERQVLLKLFTKISETEYNSLYGSDDIHFHAAEKEITEKEHLQDIENAAIHQYDEIQQGGSVLDTPVELVFNVNCVVYEKNPIGEIVNQNDLFIKTYHVPLVNQKQIKDYIDSFFKKFSTSLENVAKEVIE